MNRSLVTTECLLSDTYACEREDARHLQSVLRVRVGETVELFDGLGRTRLFMVTALRKHGLTLTALTETVMHPRPACHVTLFACVTKGARMDWTIEKAVELGASRIVPVISERTIVRVTAEDVEDKVHRFRRIAEEAARQCDTPWVPDILAPQRFADTLAMLPAAKPVFVGALMNGAQPLRTAIAACATAPTTAGWYVGPEGDFTPEELASLIDAGAIPVTLGRNILRAETACMFGLAVLNAAWMS